MITEQDLLEAIAECQGQRNPNANTCIKLAAYYIILELRVQLKNTIKNIKEIAEELNFPNQSFLGKFFREHVGMSPSKYRKS